MVHVHTARRWNALRVANVQSSMNQINELNRSIDVVGTWYYYVRIIWINVTKYGIFCKKRATSNLLPIQSDNSKQNIIGFMQDFRLPIADEWDMVNYSRKKNRDSYYIRYRQVLGRSTATANKSNSVTTSHSEVRDHLSSAVGSLHYLMALSLLFIFRQGRVASRDCLTIFIIEWACAKLLFLLCIFFCYCCDCMLIFGYILYRMDVPLLFLNGAKTWSSSY